MNLPRVPAKPLTPAHEGRARTAVRGRAGARALSWPAALALVLALLFAQALGLAHRSAHGAGPADARPAATSAAPGLKHLFAGHEQGRDCQLFDALAHGDGAAPAQPLVLAAVPAPAATWTVEPGRPLGAVLWSCPARGPPTRS